MPSEDFDKKIKEAAENASHAFDEKAWDKMVRLLDKHLPQKRKDRRRYLLLLFAFLFLGGGVFIILNKPTGPGNNNSITEQKTPGSSVNSDQNSPGTANPSLLNENSGTGPESKPGVPSITTPENASTIPTRQRNENMLSGTKKNRVKENNISGDLPATVDNNAQKPVTDKENNQEKNIIQNPVNKNEIQKKVNDPDKSGTINPVTANTDKPLTPEQQQKTSITKNDATKKPVKQKRGFLSNFAIAVSAGPDMSLTHLNNSGKIRLLYGGGLGYQFSKRMAIRTGFFVTRKIYSADPDDYNPPSNFWSYYPDLKQIDANCKIYEVPFFIDYHFGKKEDRNWFASLGVSSVFMKTEKYDYLFKPASSPQYIWYTHTYENENKHYFSSLNISGGYSRKISNSVTLRAEPYLKLPLKGIGYGKINLTSAGVLATVSVKPFAGPKKKIKY